MTGIVRAESRDSCTSRVAAFVLFTDRTASSTSVAFVKWSPSVLHNGQALPAHPRTVAGSHSPSNPSSRARTPETIPGSGHTPAAFHVTPTLETRLPREPTDERPPVHHCHPVYFNGNSCAESLSLLRRLPGPLSSSTKRRSTFGDHPPPPLSLISSNLCRI